MRTEINKFNRQTLFDNYHANDNPFSFVTTKVDITKIYQLCQKNRNYYATIGYYFAKAINQIDAFKYRYEEGKIYKYDVIRPNFTQMFKDETIGYFTFEMKDNYSEFIQEYQKIQNHFLETHQSCTKNDQGEVWFSCEPWFHFSGLIPPFDKSVTVPQIIWDKFSFEENRCYINVMIMVHHGFADGYHIGLLINTFKQIVESIEI